MSPHPLTENFSDKHPARRVDSLMDLVGNTPLVRLRTITKALPSDVEIWVKLEYLNPGGSIKDRSARQVILEAIERGELGAGQTLIDATTGDAGVAYAMLGAALGIEVELVMPDTVSLRCRKSVDIFGASVTYSKAEDGVDGAIRMVRERVNAASPSKPYYYADQYSNPANPRAHEQTTAPEIWIQTDGRVTHFVASTGSAGTLMGVNRGLKALDNSIQVYAVQPAELRHGFDQLKNLRSSMVPPVFGQEELDGVLVVSTQDGRDMAQRLTTQEGVAAGHTGGANVFAALELAQKLESGVIVTVISDHADRYLG